MTSGNHIWDKKEVARIHRARAAAAAAGQLPRRRARPRRVRRANRGRPLGGRGQRDGPRVHDAASTIPLPSCCARSRRSEPKARIIIVDMHAEATSEKIAMGWHLDGKVDARRGHPHARANRRRAHPAEGHGVSHRRGHDRAARFDHRHGDRARARPVPERHAVEVRAGDRQPAPERRRRDSRRPTGLATAITRISYSEAQLDELAVRPPRSTIRALSAVSRRRHERAEPRERPRRCRDRAPPVAPRADRVAS